MSPYDVGYFAGLLDGEGYIGLSLRWVGSNPGTPTIAGCVKVYNSDPAIVSRAEALFSAVVGREIKAIAYSPKKCTKPAYAIYVYSRDDLRLVLDCIEPHLHSQDKRARVSILRRWLALPDLSPRSEGGKQIILEYYARWGKKKPEDIEKELSRAGC